MTVQRFYLWFWCDYCPWFLKATLSVQHIYWRSKQYKVCGNDVTLLPNEVVKSFLENKTPQDLWRRQRGGGVLVMVKRRSKSSIFLAPHLDSGGPQLLLNRLVLSTLSAAALSRPFPLLSPITSERAMQPRSQNSRSSHSKQLGPRPTAVQACRSPELSWAMLLCSAHCFDFSL